MSYHFYPDYSCFNPRLAAWRKNEGIVFYFEFFLTKQLNEERESKLAQIWAIKKSVDTNVRY
ncbi:hypothetical protein PEDI_30230 [Persicobacter diffluens]|uniref:Uncharacterized protein n=1 Tax=Persicobacter diffluens TaxID=981 RepID=A0AAN5AMK1_9BACT|nr:hypothetical protein PEDI_30230 [Persicobacter diffluens]